MSFDPSERSFITIICQILMLLFSYASNMIVLVNSRNVAVVDRNTQKITIEEHILRETCLVIHEIRHPVNNG